jgi:hypothetical protein
MRARAALLVVLLAPMPAFAQEPGYSETVTVARYIVNVRVVDLSGNALPGLEPSDFRVTIGKKTAVVESAEWIGGRDRSSVAANAEAPTEEAAVLPERPGRLFILFVQTDFGRSSDRILGQLAFNTIADQIIDSLEPTDRIAVFSHDSHLKLRQDFTADADAARKAVRDSILIERIPLPPPPPNGPSLARLLDNNVLRKTSNSESALLLIARTLRSLQGEKTIILAGWGMGTLYPDGVHMKPEWLEAVSMLQQDRVPVITLGTGLGGQLTQGLVATAQSTSSFFANTRGFSQQVITRVRGVLAGYYELVLRTDTPIEPGQYPLNIVSRKGTRVFAPQSVHVNSDNQIAPQIVEVPESELVDPAHAEAVATLFVQAMREIQDGNADTAMPLLTELIAMEGAPADAWYERGLLLAGQGDLRAATTDVRKYLELDPQGQHALEAKELLKSWETSE